MAELPFFLTHESPEQLYREGSYLVLDFETFGSDKGSALNPDNDILLACWQVVFDGQVQETKHCFGGIYEMQELLDDIHKVDFLVAAFAKFELQWLKRCGLDLHDVVAYDVVLAQWVLDGNKKDPRSLEALAQRYGLPGKIDLISKLIKSGVDTRDISRRWLLEYCQQDVEATRLVFLAQQEELSKAKQWHLAHVRFLTCSVLADMEFEGLHLDPKRVQEEYVKAIEIRDRLGAALAVTTGGINLSSPKQLSTFLYQTLGIREVLNHRGEPVRTDSGEPSANSKVLALLKPTNQQQKEFLDLYREYNKQVSLLEKNLDYFKLTCEQKGGVFLGQFMQNVVQTHRLAAAGIPILFNGLKKTKSVQMQNIPREYKKLFWSGDDDWVVMEADSAQLEFRVAVQLGRDKVGRQEIESGVDVHSFTAQVLYENGDEEICGLPANKRRQESKKHTFRPLFGGGSGSKALVAYCEYFKDKYASLSKVQRSWALRCVDKKQFTTEYGMTFYFPVTKMNRNGYITNSTLIYNYPIQGFATGEIMPIALVYFWHRTKDLRVKLFSTIHDSSASRVHKDDVELAKLAAKQAFTYDVYEFLERVYHYKFTIPLGLGIKVGVHWGEGAEEKLDVFPDGREVVR